MRIECEICHEDLSGKDVEFHYRKNHNSTPSYEVLLLSLRESNEIIQKLRGFILPVEDVDAKR
jgi:hypothetical protein